jgi:hypothetical protein
MSVWALVLQSFDPSRLRVRSSLEFSCAELRRREGRGGFGFCGLKPLRLFVQRCDGDKPIFADFTLNFS